MNFFRIGVEQCKETVHKLENTVDSALCDCGQEPQTMKHMFRCPLFDEVCTISDLGQNMQQAQKCVKQ